MVYVPIMRVGFQGMIVGVEQFANSFVARLIGLGRAIGQFFTNIADRFSAFGQDIANFFNDPLAGVSFENTSKAFEESLFSGMSDAYDEMVEVAREENAKLDAELAASVDAFVASQREKVGSIADILQQQNTPEALEETGNNQKELNRLMREAQRIVDATRTPFERLSKELELYNKLLEKGLINQETFNRAVEMSNKKLQGALSGSKKKIEDEFDSLGSTMESTVADALDGISGRFDSFGDFAKGFLSDLNRQLLQFALKDLGITDEGGIIDQIFGGIGSMFGGGGSGGGGLLASIGSMFGGFFDKGGTIRPGQFGVVGERRPELAFAGSRPLHIMPMQGAGGSQVNVTMHINTPDVQGFRQSQNQIAADMARSIERAKRNI